MAERTESAAPPGEEPRRKPFSPFPALAVLALLVASQFAWVRSTNFTGFDEWLYLSLLSRGIVSFPHSNRPLQLLWGLPAVGLFPRSFEGFFLVHVAYLTLSAGLVFLLARRLAPSAPALPFLAGVVAATWAPLDMARLAVVQCSINSGATFGALLALWLFVESDRRRSVALLAAAVLIGLVTARSYEAVLGLLAGGPLLLLAPKERGWDRLRGRWVLAWESGVVLALGLALAPLLTGGGASYQREVLGADLEPARLAGRLLLQYRLHLLPLAPTTELLHVGVALAVGAFLAGSWWLGLWGAEMALPARRRLLALAALGVVFAALGYAPFVVSAQVWNATRTQFLSGFGVALLLASLFALGASLLAPRRRAPALLAAGAWVVAVGTGHTLAMQRAWNELTAYPAQRATLKQLTELAPGLAPNTLVLLVDEARAWPASFGFRHAVAYLYGPAVVGDVVTARHFLYAVRATTNGIAVLPAPSIRKAWGCLPTLHAWDEILAVRLAPTGRLSLIEEWDPSVLPPLPTGARYDPRSRILDSSPPLRNRDVLAEGSDEPAPGRDSRAGLTSRPFTSILFPGVLARLD